MPKCRLRYDVRFSRAEIDALLDHLAGAFQYDDAAGLEPDRRLIRAYDKMVYRKQQSEVRDGVVKELQVQNQRGKKVWHVGSADIRWPEAGEGLQVRDLQFGAKLDRKL